MLKDVDLNSLKNTLIEVLVNNLYKMNKKLFFKFEAKVHVPIYNNENVINKLPPCVSIIENLIHAIRITPKIDRVWTVVIFVNTILSVSKFLKERKFRVPGTSLCNYEIAQTFPNMAVLGG